jgi:hypothetical protein
MASLTLQKASLAGDRVQTYPDATGAFQVATRQAITGDTTLSGAANFHADVTTISANFTLTLPAASARQAVTITDRTGAAGTGSYIVKVAANGSETFRIPGVGTCSALYLCSDSAAFTLLGVSGVGWEVVSGTGYAVDPRSITGLFLWLDARRGVTLTSQRLISSWADFSGNSNTVTQATAAQQPVISRLPGASSLPAVYTNGAQCLNSGNVSLSSGALSAVALLATAAPGTDSVFRAIFGWNYAATTGAAFALSAGSAAFDWQTYDSFLLANGYDGGRNPRAVGYWGTVSGAIPSTRGTGPHVLAARVGASSAVIQGDGVDLISRTSAAAAVPNITTQPFTVLAEATARANPYLGWLSSFMLFTTDLSAANLSLLQADLLRQAAT